jgi:hypothetical protein
MLLAWPSPACGSGEIGPAGQEAVMDRLNPLGTRGIEAGASELLKAARRTRAAARQAT